MSFSVLFQLYHGNAMNGWSGTPRLKHQHVTSNRHTLLDTVYQAQLAHK